MSVCLPASLSFYLSICLISICFPAYMSVLSICLSLCLSGFLPTCLYLSICLYFRLSVFCLCLSTFLLICLPICLSVCLSVHLLAYRSVYLSIYPSICLASCLHVSSFVCLSVSIGVPFACLYFYLSISITFRNSFLMLIFSLDAAFNRWRYLSVCAWSCSISCPKNLVVLLLHWNLFWIIKKPFSQIFYSQK
jgi:hypothetical protein